MKKLSFALALLAVCTLLTGAAFAGKLDDIKKNGVLVAGVKDSQPPFGYVDEQSKRIVGFEIDVCKYLADKLGVKLDIKPVTSATRIPMLTQGLANIGFAGPGVIHETTGMPVPQHYHSCWKALSRGHIQGVWDRRDLRKNLHRALLTMGGRNLYYR